MGDGHRPETIEACHVRIADLEAERSTMQITIRNFQATVDELRTKANERSIREGEQIMALCDIVGESFEAYDDAQAAAEVAPGDAQPGTHTSGVFHRRRALAYRGNLMRGLAELREFGRRNSSIPF